MSVPSDAGAVLPYDRVLRQDALKQALELAYVMPSIGGVLVSGERGTAKSTTVRAFSRMLHGQFPVTLPINATDDRVLGGWEIEALMRGEARAQTGLLELASGKMLYIDEVNLLDDHIINIILDVVSTGLLEVQREGLDRPATRVSFTLVGTMNPEEGSLRPQLLDRFGLMVPMVAEQDVTVRKKILLNVLTFEQERLDPGSVWLREASERDRAHRDRLHAAKETAQRVEFGDEAAELCARLAIAFELVGHRGEIVMAQASRAAAALAGRSQVTAEDIRRTAPYAIMHRRPEAAYGEGLPWTEDDVKTLNGVVPEEA